MAEPMGEKDPYQTLGVKKDASTDDIRNAYRKLAKKLHPDLNPGNKEAERKFKSVNAAYELLADQDKRARFDRGEIDAEGKPRFTGAGPEAGFGEGGAPFQGGFYRTQQGGDRYAYEFGGIDPDLFSSIFGKMGGASRARGGPSAATGPETGEDRLYRMQISFLDAIRGGEREITLPGGKRLRVRIPAGVESGTKLRFRGQGEPGFHGGPGGDAYVEIDVSSSNLYTRAGRDVLIEVPIALREAVLGAEIRVPTPDGPVMLRVPPGVSSGAKLRIRGRGIPSPSAAEARGDEIVSLRIVLPPTRDASLEEAIRKWAGTQPDPRAELEARAKEAA